jgi:hypothetical protein
MMAGKKAIRIDDIWKKRLRWRNVDRLFDFVCTMNYTSGYFDDKMPVDNSRKVLERIKKLIKEAK